MPELESSGSIPFAGAAVAILFAAAIGLGGLVVRPAMANRWRSIDALLVRLTIGLNLLGMTGVVLGLTGVLANGRSVWLLAGLSLLWIPSKWWNSRVGKSNSHTTGATAGLPSSAGNTGGQATRGTLPPGQATRGTLPRGNAARSTPPRAQVTGGTHRRSLVGGLAGLLAIATAVMTLGPALCYPTGWDELVYHGVLPQRWLVQGWPAFYQDLPYSGFPSFGEILFWLMAPIENVIAPRLLAWACWILGLVCLYRLLRRRLSATTATVFTLAFTLSDTVLLISANCYVESILLLQVAALLLAVRLPGWRGPAGGAWPRAAILGILAGGAAAVKLTGCSVLAVPCIWYAGQLCLDRTRWRSVIGPWAIYVFVALCVALPFYVRPWLATGNPFYPYLCGWFTDDAAQLEMSRYHHDIGGFRFGVKSVAAFVDAPLLLAFRSENYDGRFGWQLLVLVLLAIVAVVSAGRRRLRPSVLWPLAVTVWFYVFWFATAQQARFAVHFVLALLLLATVGMRILPRKWRRLVLLTLVPAMLFSVPWWRSDYYFASWLTVAGRLTRTDYVHNVTDRVHLPLIQAIQALTSRDAKFLLLFEHRGFYLSRHYVIGTPFFQEGLFTPPEQFADAESVMNVLKQNEITHVVAAKVNPGPDQAPGWIERQQPFLRAVEQCVQQRQLIRRWESDEYVLLEVAK